MNRKNPLPIPSLALAGITSAGLWVAGVSAWLALAVLLLWGGSVWLARGEPEIVDERVDRGEVSRDAMRETIEPLGMPVLVLEDARIIMANAAARAALGSHVTGQDARIALRHPEAMRMLGMDDGASVSIPGFTAARSLWQLTRRNIDERRWMIELADRTAEADVGRAHTDFVANASHELRTPLAAIIGYVETLQDAPPTDAATTERFLGIIHREAKRMSSLVEDLMSLSHVEAEKHDRPTDRIDLSRLCARVVAEVSTLKGKERVVLASALETAPILGDSRQLEQLLRNLVDNALKYGDADQPVQVSVGTGPRGTVRLSVTDHGPGIAPQHIPHLTRRFYRTDPGRSRASGGTGLGLAIVKHIVERHRANLDISSTLGEGTTVCVDIPSAPELPAEVLS